MILSSQGYFRDEYQNQVLRKYKDAVMGPSVSSQKICRCSNALYLCTPCQNVTLFGHKVFAEIIS